MERRRLLIICVILFGLVKSIAASCGREAYKIDSSFTVIPSTQFLPNDDAFSFVWSKLTDGKKEDEETVLTLLQQGAINPHFKNPEGATLVHVAAYHGAYEVVRYLVYEEKIPLMQDEEGKNPLHRAVGRKDCRALVELLLAVRKDQVFEKDCNGREPFFYVSDDDIGDLLLEAGGNVNSVDKTGRSPLFYYAGFATTAFLCSRGADINRADYRDLSVLEAYLEYYFDANEREQKGLDPIYSSDNIKQSIGELLRYGATIPSKYHFSQPLSEPSFLSGVFFGRRRKGRASLLQERVQVILRHAEENILLLKRMHHLIKQPFATARVHRVCDQILNARPFFNARAEEAKILFEGTEGASGEQPFDRFQETKKMLASVSLSKTISPGLQTCMQLAFEHSDRVLMLSEEEKTRLGASFLETLVALQEPDDHAAQ